MFGLEAEDEDFKPADVDGEVVLERFHGGVINFCWDRGDGDFRILLKCARLEFKIHKSHPSS